jgi:hypothetical protein
MIAVVSMLTISCQWNPRPARGASALPGRDLVIAVRNDLLTEGKDVSLVRLCRRIGVPRSTV